MEPQAEASAAPDVQSKLIVDTGASLGLADKAEQSRKEKETLRDAEEPVTLNSANGKTESSEQIDRKVPRSGITIEPHVLDNCPDVLSVGQRCQGEGFEFRWKPFSDRPYFVRPDGVKVFCQSENYVPMLFALSGQGCVEGRALSVGEPPGYLQIDGGSALSDS